MATFYIDPDTGSGSGVGSEADPFKAWTEVTWTAGNSYLQKRGTTYIGFITLGATGTLGSEITISVYGDGSSRAILDVLGSSNGILANVKEYIIIEDFEVKNASAMGIAHFTNNSKAGKGCRIRRCYSHSNGGGGIIVTANPNFAAYTVVDDFIIEDCISEDNGGHGISIVGEIRNGAIIRASTADNNGLTVNSWGVYMSPRGVAYVGTGWSSIAGGSGFIYQLDHVTETALETNEVIQSVLADGRTDGGKYVLTEGTFGSLASDEWAQSGSLLQVDIGENPDGKTININTTTATNGLIYDCEAANHTVAVSDGVGIGFDHGMEDSTIERCKSHNNGGDGIQINIGINCKVNGNECYSNVRAGIAFPTTGQDAAQANAAANNTVYDNGTSGLWCKRAPKAIFYNNITFSNGKGVFFDTDSTGAVTDYNCDYNNTASGDSGANDITTDPLFIDEVNSNYNLQQASPCVGVGVKWWGLNPRPESLAEPLPDVDIDLGAYMSTWSPNHPANL